MTYIHRLCGIIPEKIKKEKLEVNLNKVFGKSIGLAQTNQTFDEN
jgi:hypothetical protein